MTADSPAALLAELRALRREVAAEGRARRAAWGASISRPEFTASALNLAHYLALRRRDLRPLQRALMRHGLSSLGRLEGRVLATLDAVLAALEAMTGERAPGTLRFPAPRTFFRGETTLARNSEALFGRRPDGRPGRIMVTLPSEAASEPAFVAGLLEDGRVDAVRINCAHDDAAAWRAMLGHVRRVAGERGRPVAVLMDLGGPKCRTELVLKPEDGARLEPGDRLLLTRGSPDRALPYGFQASCSLPQVLDRLAVGDRIFVDDGHFAGAVEALPPAGAVLRIDRARPGGGKLKPDKGLNFPDTDLALDPLTAEDLAALDLVAAEADAVGYSFVQDPADVARLQDELARRRPDWQRLAVVAKIETARAVRNLPELIVAAAGRQPLAVMIARGDLAVEIGFERLAEMQEEILWICEAAQVPVIWATQVLESLVKTGLPSRGEMTDAAMSARAECVMLNKGENVGAAVAVLDRLLGRMAGHQVKKTPTLRALRSW
ncbi:MAG: pyruvate kinase [Dongiaceae bacterium]